ncbi:MAG TPA: inorganic pyrophosphatase Ppa [Thermodesulfobacteriota bacterium]|nr:inorganic pyrophosphatase Ppa [Thermodesulfobacteriota bacterium]
MPIRNFPQEVKKFEIEAYKRPRNSKELRKSHVPFSGSPSKHPYDPDRVILVPDPYSSSPFYYEFKSADIEFVEKLPNIVDLDGETIKMARLWLKKRSVGMLCTPFLVEETRETEPQI